jgi:predicted phage-related endonuclease
MATQGQMSFLEERKTGLGGSDIGSVYNIGFGCQRKLAYEKRGFELDYPKPNPPEFERGNYIEPVVLQLYQDYTGRELSPANIERHPDYPYMLVHMDAVASSPEKDGPGYFEAKVVNRFVMKRFMKEGLRDEYILQMQHGLSCTGFKWGSFGVLCLESWSFKWFDVDRDEAIITKLIEDEAAFWAKIENGPMPEPLEDAKDRRCQTCPYRKTCRAEELSPTPSGGEGGEIVSAPELSPLFSECVELESLKDEATQMYEEARGRLKDAVGERYGVVAPGFRALYPTWTEERWDTKALGDLEKLGKTLSEGVSEDFPEASTSELLTFLRTFLKARKPPVTKRSLRIYATGD